MKALRSFVRNERGATAIEFAFAFPILMVMIWMIVELGMVFRATAGIQHALGEGARYATIYPRPANSDVEARMAGKVYGIGPGTFTIDPPADGTGYVDLKVNYTQQTTLLFLPGPTITVSRSKRVWVAA
jgi:Flp pilus assembly protein TadG